MDSSSGVIIKAGGIVVGIFLDSSFLQSVGYCIVKPYWGSWKVCHPIVSFGVVCPDWLVGIFVGVGVGDSDGVGVGGSGLNSGIGNSPL